MTTTTSPIAAVKLLRSAIEGIHVMFGLTATGKQVLDLTASIEQPTSEAVDLPSPMYFEALAIVHKAGYASISMVQRKLAISWNAAENLVHLMIARADVSAKMVAHITSNVLPATPPAKEAILQAMVDQAQELGLYDDAPINSVPAQTGTIGTLVESCKERHHMHPNSCDNRNQCWEPCGELGKSAEHTKVVEWPISAVNAPEYKAEQRTKNVKARKLLDAVAGAPVDERAALIRDALDIAFDLVSEEAHRIHETYKGYKPDRHAAIDADVATVIAARAALQQPGQAGKVPEGYKLVPIVPTAAMLDEAGQRLAAQEFPEPLPLECQADAHIVWDGMLSAAPSAKDKP